MTITYSLKKKKKKEAVKKKDETFLLINRRIILLAESGQLYFIRRLMIAHAACNMKYRNS